jgi:hypothetical protein
VTDWTIVTGFSVYLIYVPIWCISKAKRGVRLFSSEIAFVAISEALKNTKFIYYLLREVMIEVDLPITLKMDNIGPMFKVQNTTCGLTTRHLDRLYHHSKI